MEKSNEDAGLALAQKFYAMLFRGAKQLVETGEQHAPVLFALSDGDRLGVMPEVAIMPRELAAAVQRKLSDMPGVRCTAFVSEAWSYIRAPGMHETRAQAEAIERAEKGGSLADVPGAQDCVMFSIRVGPRVFIATCPIEEVKRGRRTLAKAELVDTAADGAKWQGRFVEGGLPDRRGGGAP